MAHGARENDVMVDRPNILLITTDQQRGDCLGAERSAHPVMTPHLDQIAAGGVRFARAYSDCPICVPARTTIMTGRTAYHHGITGNMDKRIPEEPALTLPGRLAGAGYQTHAAGKMHFFPPRRRNGFDRMRLVPEDYVNWLEETPYPGGYRGHGMGGGDIYPVFTPLPIQYTATHWTVDESIAFLRQRDPDFPFFMWTSFEAPHPPYDPPEQFVRLYDGVEIPSPVVGEWATSDGPATGGVPYTVQQSRWAKGLDRLPPTVLAAARRHYYAQITHVDYELGRLIGELRTQGLWKDTVVIFTSDHGDMLGDHVAFHKGLFYEPSARVPLLLRVPPTVGRSLSPGTVVPGPVILADVYATCLDLAGLWTEQDEAERDGRSLVSQPNGRRSDDATRWVYGMFGPKHGSYMATDGRWKYMYYVWGGTEQLFDLHEDPGECVDLAAMPSAGTVVDECRRRLLAEFPELVNPGERDAGRLPFARVMDQPPDEAAARASGSAVLRGPLRYGSHW